MRIGAVCVTLMLTSSSAFAIDASVLPQSCKDTLAALKSDKARFTELGKEMQKYRKATNTTNFCTAAKATVMIIKEQSSRIDDCVGDAVADKTIPPKAVDQMTQLRGAYKQMLDAAKDPKNDQVHCGLAEL